MWIVIEKFPCPEMATICMNQDGENMVFESEAAAQAYAEEECQFGVVIEY